jgi:hypothetical protein
MKRHLVRGVNTLINAVQRPVRRLLGRDWKYYEDDFTRFLTYINAGMLERGNVHLFDYVARNLPAEGAVLEIGSFAGLSTNLIIYFLQQHGQRRPFYTVDPWKLKDDDVVFFNGKFSFRDYNGFVKESFRRNVAFFSPDQMPYSIEDLSVSFFAKWERHEIVCDVFGRSVALGGALSFAYIDGDHAPDAVRRDFAMCDRYLAPNGFVLFDDSTWPTLAPVMDEVLGTGRYALVMRNPNYLFRKIN